MYRGGYDIVRNVRDVDTASRGWYVYQATRRLAGNRKKGGEDEDVEHRN